MIDDPALDDDISSSSSSNISSSSTASLAAARILSKPRSSLLQLLLRYMSPLCDTALLTAVYVTAYVRRVTCDVRRAT
jgi:hypothetical protein